MSKRGEFISNPKNFIANLRKLTQIYEFLQKKKNEISKNWQKNIKIWGYGRPLSIYSEHPKSQWFPINGDSLVFKCCDCWVDTRNFVDNDLYGQI